MYTYTFYASGITQNSCPEAAQLIALGSQMHHMMLHQITDSFIHLLHASGYGDLKVQAHRQTTCLEPHCATYVSRNNGL